MISCLTLFALCSALAFAPQEPQPKASVPLAAVDATIARGAEWLRGRQRENGAFEPAGEHDVCPLAVSAMAIWSLCDSEPRCLDAEAADRGARFLLSRRHDDGGIYDASRGLTVYTSGVSVRALRSLGKRPDWPELATALAEAELFNYRNFAPESIVDATQAGESPSPHSATLARELLRGAPPADEARRRALEFLSRSTQNPLRLPLRLRQAKPSHAPSEVGPFSYDDLLPFVYYDLSPDQQLALRARAALVAYYTPERNPDLTRRYGGAGFARGTQGLFYYYFVVAKTLSTFAQPTLVTADGVSHDWAAELSARLLRLQRDDGSWANSDAVWWESEPVLASSYALLTLKLCRASLARSAGPR